LKLHFGAKSYSLVYTILIISVVNTSTDETEKGMHYQVKIRQAVGSLLKLLLRTNAIAATKQVGYGMG